MTTLRLTMDSVEPLSGLVVTTNRFPSSARSTAATLTPVLIGNRKRTAYRR
jgi:hypothetical protein